MIKNCLIISLLILLSSCQESSEEKTEREFNEYFAEITNGAPQHISFVILSNKQAYGSFNEEVQVISTKKTTNDNYAIKLEESEFKIIDLANNETVFKDVVMITGANDKIIRFETLSGQRGEADLITCSSLSPCKYLYNKEEKYFAFYKTAEYVKTDPKEKNCQAAKFEITQR